MNPQTAGQWVAVAPASAVAPGQMKGVVAGGREIAVYNVENAWFATDNVCTHAFGCLTDGWLEGDVDECPLHGGRFSVKTGMGMGPPIPCDIQVYPVRVVNGQIEVGLP